MIFTETPLKGAYVIELNKNSDDRGFFSRVFCKTEFGEQGLTTNIVQINNALSTKRGTFRGMHYQLPPAAEVKLVRCITGALYDAILDLRPDSPTFCQSFGLELTSENRKMLYVPRGFAHGIITMEDHTEVFYLTNNFYAPNEERGIRYNDPKFNIQWPLEFVEISEKDRKWPDFDPEYHGIERMKNIT